MISNVLNVNYSIDGRRKKIARTGGATTTYGLANNNYALDDGVHLQTFIQNFTGTANDLTTTFTFTASNQIETLSKTNSLYYYQGNDNRIGVYVPNGLNQYTHIADRPLAYDGQANLTNDGTQVYTYDAENRLLTTSGTTTSSFVYDPNGRLFQSTIGSTVTQYVYDGDALIGEYNGSGTLLRRYVHGDQVDEPLVQYNSSAIGASNRRYLHTDHQGSIIAHSDSSGNVFATNGTLAYDAYGIAATKNNSVAGAFGYTGQVYFPTLGLNYYKARFYHPKLGRFLQTDPIGYKDDMDLYSYVGNDPVNNSDPSGLSCSGECGKPDDWKNELSSNWMSYLPRSNNTNGSNNSNSSSKTPIVIDDNKSAVDHYYNGSGESVVLGKNTVNALLSHPTQVEKAKRISAGLSSLRSGNYQVDMTKQMFHVGRTRVEYTQECGSGACSTTFRAFVNDGFWDANIAAPWAHDGPGPGGELGGSVYSYEVYEWLDIYVSPYTSEIKIK